MTLVRMTNYLLQFKVLPLNHVLHVIHALAHAPRIAGCEQSVNPVNLVSELVGCGNDVILDYCDAGSSAL